MHVVLTCLHMGISQKEKSSKQGHYNILILRAKVIFIFLIPINLINVVSFFKLTCYKMKGGQFFKNPLG